MTGSMTRLEARLAAIELILDELLAADMSAAPERWGLFEDQLRTYGQVEMNERHDAGHDLGGPREQIMDAVLDRLQAARRRLGVVPGTRGSTR